MANDGSITTTITTNGGWMSDKEQEVFGFTAPDNDVSISRNMTGVMIHTHGCLYVYIYIYIYMIIPFNNTASNDTRLQT